MPRPMEARMAAYETSDQNKGIVNTVRNSATAQLTNQKNRATDGLGNVVDAVRQTTQQLRDHNHDTLARYAEQTANQIDRFSQRLRDKDIGELMNDVQRLSRKQPALFIGGAFAVGLLSARFFKSSNRDGGDGATRRDRPSEFGGTGGEYRSYAQPGSPMTSGSGQLSQVHDYQSAGNVGGTQSAASEIPPDTGTGDPSRPTGSTRSRRGQRTERT